MSGKRITSDVEERICVLYQQGVPFKEIMYLTRKGASTVDRVLTRSGLPRRGKRHGSSTRMGSKSSSWTGGRFITPQGYIRVRVDYSKADPIAHAMSNAQKTVFEHRLVMAWHLGRPLRANETVHHKNGDKTDNRIENLELRGRFHGVGQTFCCGDCGSSNIIPSEAQ